MITPHPQEAARLLHTTVADIQADRPAAVLALAAQYHCWAVLKGHRSLIASPDGELWCNHSGNRGLATAGSGMCYPVLSVVCWHNGCRCRKPFAAGLAARRGGR